MSREPVLFRKRIPFLVMLMSGVMLIHICARPARAGDRALTVYSGRLTGERWLESLSLNTGFVDAYVLVGAFSWPVKDLRENDLTLEIEVQAARYFGDQDHLEFNAPLALRWRMFPWSGSVDTSIAFGIGPSWATEDPEVERTLNSSTRQLLVYWFLEVALGPPSARWAGVFRLHHRSTGYGALAGAGGSNTLAAGVKFRF